MNLKQLQAEWRAESAYIKPEHGWSFYKQCADALTPYIEQQERDMKLIMRLKNELYSYCAHPNWNKSLMEEARSRLKEVE